MKLLLVHMRYYPDATGTAPLVTQLAQDIVQDGVEVEVITSRIIKIDRDFSTAARKTEWRLSELQFIFPAIQV